jgi:hypothetical protein
MSWFLRVAAVIWALAAVPAAAHLTPNSEVQLDPRETEVLADIIVPRGEYAYATGNPVDGSPASLATARRYLLDRLEVSGKDGAAWTVKIDTIEFVQIAGPPDLHATARLIPAKGSVPRQFAIDWRVVVDELPSHFALFILTGPSGKREILGAVRQGQTRLTANFKSSSTWSLLSSAIALGAQHIVGGYDHLLFLLALLLPAPLIARAGRWSEPRGARDTLAKLAGIVTAFTVGHSITLIGATLGGWQLPTAPVEIAIAVSVLVSAIHAIRPLVPGREPLIAAGFGLVHGLAFATLVLQADAGAASSAASLLGFNLGIELVQLAVVLAVAPSLLILSRGPWYTPIRLGLAAFAAIASVGWTVNRATGAAVGFVGTMEEAMSHAAWAVIALALLALVSRALPKTRRAMIRL